MPILYDTHMHSSFSEDSDTPMADMVKSARGRGLEGVIFTEHVDLDYPEKYGNFHADVDGEYREVCRIRADLAAPCAGAAESLRPEESFFTGFGIECGMQKGLSARYSEIIRSHPFDFVIASQHLVGRDDPYFPESWAGHDAEAYITMYFEQMYENLREMEQWDTLAHMDYIIRYIPDAGIEGGSFDSSSGAACSETGEYQKMRSCYDAAAHHGEIIDEILRLIIESGRCLEVNTAGYKYGLGQPNPSPEILKRYRDLGGSAITIGADAHVPKYIGCAFAQTRELLLSLGFRTYTVFSGRTPEEFEL